MRNELLNDIEAVLEKLGNISKTCMHDNAEDEAIRLAAFALLFIKKEQLESKLSQFIEEENAPLTDEQRDHLKRMGLEE